MSGVIIAGNTSGSVTLDAPAVAGSTVITLPTTSGTMLLTNGNGSALTNLPTPTALSTASGSAPSYSARAWVNFNGTGTVAVRTSGNVTSITDNGVGNYTVNFTTALSNANYMMAGSITRSGFPQTGTIGPRYGGTFTTSALQIATADDGGTVFDPPYVGVVVFSN